MNTVGFEIVRLRKQKIYTILSNVFFILYAYLYIPIQ